MRGQASPSRGWRGKRASSGSYAELQWRERLAEDMRRGGALVLHVAPAELTGQLIQRYLAVKRRQRL